MKFTAHYESEIKKFKVSRSFDIQAKDWTSAEKKAEKYTPSGFRLYKLETLCGPEKTTIGNKKQVKRSKNAKDKHFLCLSC